MIEKKDAAREMSGRIKLYVVILHDRSHIRARAHGTVSVSLERQRTSVTTEPQHALFRAIFLFHTHMRARVPALRCDSCGNAISITKINSFVLTSSTVLNSDSCLSRQLLPNYKHTDEQKTILDTFKPNVDIVAKRRVGVTTCCDFISLIHIVNVCKNI